MPVYNGRIAIVGAAESDYGRVPNMTELQLHAQAIQRALEDSGLRKSEIDGVFSSSDTLIEPTVMISEYLQLFPRYTDTTSIGGASFEAHLNHAVAAIRAGKCDVALITYASTQLSSSGRMIGTGARPATIPEDTYEAPYGNTLVGAYAMAAHRGEPSPLTAALNTHSPGSTPDSHTTIQSSNANLSGILSSPISRV